MLMFALIGLSFVLIGMVGLQFTYLFYADRLHRERQKYLQTLEKRFARLAEKLKESERRVAEQNKLLEAADPKLGRDDEVWADVIEEH